MGMELTVHNTLDITDVAGQLSERSQRIYKNDAQVFVAWVLKQGLSIEALTRSHMIAYRKFLSETYAKATAQRMFSVSRRILQEQVYSGKLTSNPADGIKGFQVANETTHTALTKGQAKELFQSVDTSSLKGLRD